MSATKEPELSAASMPEVRGGVVSYLQVSNASEASAFYQRAFGATEVFRVPLDEKGRTMHIHLYVNDGSLMLTDPYPEYGYPLERPQAFSLILQVNDIDAWWSRAVAAGAEIVKPIEKMFWGARYAEVRDPFGVLWAFNEPQQ